MATATETKITTRKPTDRDRLHADAFWDALADTGHVDSRGGAEYTRVFASGASERRVKDYAKAARGLVASVARSAKQTAATN
jgi:hypothetical protein